MGSHISKDAKPESATFKGGSGCGWIDHRDPTTLQKGPTHGCSHGNCAYESHFF